MVSSKIIKIWDTLNRGILGYVFFMFLGVVAAVAAVSFMGLALDTSMPLVAVVSGSMDHGLNEGGFPCGNSAENYKESFENWWDVCSSTYSGFGITKDKFSGFSFKDGLKKGDIAVLQNSNKFEAGEIVVYNIPFQKVPIIHRVVQVNQDNTYQTKGDHNLDQNSYEFSVPKEQIRGKVIFVVPYLGYIRLILPISQK